MLSALLLGFLVGMHHALEPDHVAAVASMISGTSTFKSKIKQGVAWGVGHAATLLIVATVVFVAGLGFSGALSHWLELGVGVMLIGLGCHVIWRLYRERWHIHVHDHGRGLQHFHFHSHVGENASRSTHKHQHWQTRLPLRAAAVGVMHGMAGSAALVVIAAAAFGSFATALTYVLVFGLGTIAGMALLSASIALPMSWSSRMMNPLHTVLQLTIGATTSSLGLFIVYNNISYLAA